ncbi:MAG: toll/interleukin-1 receptor domain-containing protein [Thaumarchaeota archaeon]|nr:toll/interleukin-1 receptor domain-containing protein [Nitrososphaerota archaeon]
MKVFISFDSKDSQLAYTLRDILKEKDIDGYLFDLDQKYDSTLYNKITTAIDDSRALVAIITKDMYSPSVHEEIGYAIVGKKSVTIMLEQDATDGVLSHEREKEIFTKEDFENSCKRVLGYLEKLPKTTIKTTNETFQTFLQKRYLLDQNSSHFGINPNSKKLRNRLPHLAEVEQPFVLFSASPTNLLDDLPVNSRNFEEWLEKFRSIELENSRLVFYKGTKKIGLDTVSYFYDHPSEYSRYLEFNSNGFVEQGFTDPLIYPFHGSELSDAILLHLCWMSGAFWAFLLFYRKYCEYMAYDGEFDISLSIRNANSLMLMGFGGSTDNNAKWSEPWTSYWDVSKPKTEKTNIQIKKHLNLNSLTDKKIKELTREFSDKIANAYGLEFALCYNNDGTINQELINYYNKK